MYVLDKTRLKENRFSPFVTTAAPFLDPSAHLLRHLKPFVFPQDTHSGWEPLRTGKSLEGAEKEDDKK